MHNSLASCLALATRRWCSLTARGTLRDARSAELDLMRPGKPVENAFAESFIGSLRGERLDEDWFPSLRQSREIMWPGGGTATKSAPTAH
jgi:transposase InsO family protein